MTIKGDDVLAGLLSRYVHEVTNPNKANIDILKVLRDDMSRAIILDASAGLCYAIEDKHDNGGKTTKLMTRYRVRPGTYEMIPVVKP